MSGLNFLSQFPEEVKEKIIVEFGSIQNLYKKIFDLYQRQHSLYRIKPIDNQAVANIDNEIYEIEEKLEELGVEDGSDITSEISSDFGEIIVKKENNTLDLYFKERGTDYETMRSWLKDEYGI
jgi:hypothetical protein